MYMEKVPFALLSEDLITGPLADSLVWRLLPTILIIVMSGENDSLYEKRGLQCLFVTWVRWRIIATILFATCQCAAGYVMMSPSY